MSIPEVYFYIFYICIFIISVFYIVNVNNVAIVWIKSELINCNRLFDILISNYCIDFLEMEDDWKIKYSLLKIFC